MTSAETVLPDQAWIGTSECEDAAKPASPGNICLLFGTHANTLATANPR
jgi:hypothetical protein